MHGAEPTFDPALLPATDTHPAALPWRATALTATNNATLTTKPPPEMGGGCGHSIAIVGAVAAVVCGFCAARACMSPRRVKTNPTGGNRIDNFTEFSRFEVFSSAESFHIQRPGSRLNGYPGVGSPAIVVAFPSIRRADADFARDTLTTQHCGHQSGIMFADAFLVFQDGIRVQIALSGYAILGFPSFDTCLFAVV